MKKIVIHPQNVCSREIQLEYDDKNIITSCQFLGGCQGNTSGIAKLIIGLPLNEVVEKLEGIPCRGSRTGLTSCPDQLAKGIKEVL